MTKDELYKSIASPNCVSINSVSIGNYLDEFFESNVCIPKGENRHPYADVLHEWVEKRKVEYTFKLDGVNIGWFSLDYDVLNEKYEYRIKPKEPVYEWVWYMGTIYGFDVNTDQFYTEEEMEGHQFTKKIETQRERK